MFKELDIFLTMKVLEKHACSIVEESFSMKTHILMNGSTVKNHIIKNGSRLQYNTENFVPIVVPGLSTSSSSSSHTGESSFYTFLKLVYFHQPQLCQSDSETRAREDLSGIDSHPVSVSSEHVERKEREDPFSKPTQSPKPNKNEDHENER